MLKTIRKHRKGIFGSFVAFLICLAMVGFGLDSFFNRDQRRAAIQVDETEVSFNEYYRRLNQLQNAYRNQFREQYDKIAPMLRLEDQVENQLINSVLLQKFAADAGFVSGENAVRRKILEHDFLKGGATKESYQAFLRATNMSEPELVARIGEELTVDQMRDVMGDLSELSKIELSSIAREGSRKIVARYVEFSPSVFAEKVDINDSEALKAHYVDTAEQYRKTKSVKFMAVPFNAADFAPKVELTEEEINSAYEEKKDQYFTDRRVTFRQILLKKQVAPATSLESMVQGEEKATGDLAAANQLKKTKAEELLKQIKEGANFADLARANSEDEATKANGGLVDWTTLEGLTPAVRAAINVLDPGEQSTVVEATDGYYLVSVEGKEDRRQKTLDEVRNTVTAELRADLAPEYANAAAEVFLGELEKRQSVTDNIQSVAQQSGYRVISSGDFLARGQGTPELPAELSETASGMAPNQRQLVVAGNTPFVIEVVEVKDSYVPEFDEAKPAVQANYQAVKAAEMAKQAAEDALTALNSSAAPAGAPALEAVAKSVQVAVKTTPELSKSAMQPDPLLQHPDLRRAVFSLNMSEPRSRELIAANGNFYLLELVSEKQSDQGTLAGEIETLAKQDAGQTGNRMLEALTAALKADTTVWINPDLDRDKDS